jgi:DNA-binding response OmpR family regulator
MARILLLEPDSVLNNIYREALVGGGHIVNPVFDAQNAINITEKFIPELIIIELQLPVHNGIEFLYELRSYADWQSIPVIILSFVPSNEFQLNHSLWQDLGVVNYLYKPNVSLHQLLSIVREQMALLTA